MVGAGYELGGTTGMARKRCIGAEKPWATSRQFRLRGAIRGGSKYRLKPGQEWGGGPGP